MYLIIKLFCLLIPLNQSSKGIGYSDIGPLKEEQLYPNEDIRYSLGRLKEFL